jgi:hypothetical protein
MKEKYFLHKMPINRHFSRENKDGAFTFLRQNAGKILFLDKMPRGMDTFHESKYMEHLLF